VRGLTLVGPVGSFTWRMLATVMAGEALAVFFGALVARSLAEADEAGSGTPGLVAGSVLAGGCLVAAGLMRGRWGVPLGWLIQVVTLVSAVVVPMMVAVFLVFGGLWVFCLVQGDRVDAAMARRASGDDSASG
jgi:hypothetical protein